jgi:hypothetical protein
MPTYLHLSPGISQFTGQKTRHSKERVLPALATGAWGCPFSHSDLREHSSHSHTAKPLLNSVYIDSPDSNFLAG